MYPDEFEYHSADSVESAVSLLAENPEAELIAGGHSLLPTMKSGLASPDALVDISGVDGLEGVERDGDSTRIGAMTTYAEVADDDQFWEDATVVAETAGEIGDRQVRNRGTVGGNIAHADPASDLPGAMLAADATVHVHGPDGGVEVPHEDGDTASGYVKKPSPSSGYAMVGVAARLTLDGDSVADARVAANGVMDHGTRLSGAEDALEDETLDADAVEAAGAAAGDDLDEYMVMEDQQASAEFRLQLLSVYTERALEKVGERAGAL
ncbi:xanthine dehydrogenase family protein subunit M [Halobacteriales archaeon QS_5_68_33]|nr:MAG: xanthine dehydrogenase family protein subunit M [Halobacteriales archaeon QS_5_68_33]